MKEFEELIIDLKNKIYKPIYFFMGDEPYYIDLVTDYITTHVLTYAEKAFNQTVMYGKDVEVTKIIEAARRFPMMANQQVIVVKEAQELKKSIDELAIYVEKPQPSTILVINYKYESLDKRTKLYKALNKHVVLESKKLYDNQVPEWITKFLKSKKISIEPEAAVMISESLGSDLSKIVNEIEKLLVLLPQGTALITRSHVEKNIGISKDYNVFELNKALGAKNVLKANRIINYFDKNPKAAAMVVVVTNLFNFFSKVLIYHYLPDKSKNAAASALGVNPFFVGDYEQAAKRYPIAKVVAIIHYLREYDMKSKGVGSAAVSDGELMREMVYKILH